MGSTALITSASGVLKSRIRYTPFGEIFAFDDNTPNQNISPTTYTDRLFAGYKLIGGRFNSATATS